jgi:hypothetical protein
VPAVTSDDGLLRSVLAQALFETSKVVFFTPVEDRPPGRNQSESRKARYLSGS